MEEIVPYGEPAADPLREEQKAKIREVLHWHARGNGGPEKSIRAYDIESVVNALVKGLFGEEDEA